MEIIKTTRRLAQAILDFALPPRCLSCGVVVEGHGTVCAECWNDITFISSHKCETCGLPFEFDMGDKALCRSCNSDKPHFHNAVSACRYEGTARKLTIKLKFTDSLHLAPHMAKMMLSSGNELALKSDIITPVPMHFRRRVVRKYNQAALLAKNIASQSGKEYLPFLLKRTRHTKQQTRLHKKDRKENVAGAFLCSGDIHGKTIMLVDDVMTTGATLSACALALKEKGAKKVYCLTFARSVPEKL